MILKYLRYATTIFALIGIMMAGTAIANEFEDAVIAQLAAAASVAEDEGYGMSHDPYVDKLSGGKDELTLTLHRDVDYAIIGVCDTDCGDVDIRLYDENNNLVDEDVTTDDFPVVEVNPKWTGKFTVQVEMYKCARTPCYYAIGVFAK